MEYYIQGMTIHKWWLISHQKPWRSEDNWKNVPKENKTIQSIFKHSFKNEGKIKVFQIFKDLRSFLSVDL